MVLPLNRLVVYGLADPIDGLIRYVGVSASPQRRLSEHLRCPKKESIAKNGWISGLKEKGLAPIFIFIDSVSIEEAEEKEYFWINHFSKLGHLFNGKIKMGPKENKKLPDV